VLVSLAVVPILVSVGKMPSFESAESVSIRQLCLVSPLGVVGMLVRSVVMRTIFGMGAVYASFIGLSVQEISFFKASIIAGGAVMQFPLGQMSDVFGRRLIIIGICLVGALTSLFASHFSGSGWLLYAVIALVGGLSTPLYALCAAHTNDYLSQPQMVAASGTLVLVSGIGAAMGPPVTAFAMEQLGSLAFFYSIVVSLGLVAIFGLWRSTR
jgi:MFS family permease